MQSPARKLSPNEERDALMAAMAAELERSEEGLDVEDAPEPYFLAYALRRSDELRLRGAYGGLVRDRSARRHHVYADVRVGEPAFDNVLDGGLNVDATERESADWLEAADHLDPEVLRVSLWKLSEIKFDEAVEDYYDHKKAFVSEYLRDEVDAMGPADVVEHLEDAAAFALAEDALRGQWAELVAQASSRFLAHPEVYDPAVELIARQVQRWYLNTEGTRVFTRDLYWNLSVSGWVLSEDGVYIEGSRATYGRSLASLPTPEAVDALVDAVLEDLRQLEAAQSPGSFIGPALLSGQAAATMFHEALGHRLEGERLVARGETRTFAHKMGERILPAGLDVYDDPLVEREGEQELWGHYRVDDEGVPSQRADLIRDGVLVGFLQSRKPTPHADRSNGHGRHDGVQPVMARMGNLFVRGNGKGATRSELEAELLRRAKAAGNKHALIIEHIRAGETSTDSYDFQVFKGELAEVYLVDVESGQRRRVRDLELIGTPLSAMQRIVAYGDQAGIDYGSCYAESGAVPVSGVAPALLLSEVELQQKSSSGFHEPLLPPPFADDGSRGRAGGKHERGRRKKGD